LLVKLDPKYVFFTKLKLKIDPAKTNLNFALCLVSCILDLNTKNLEYNEIDVVPHYQKKNSLEQNLRPRDTFSKNPEISKFG